MILRALREAGAELDGEAAETVSEPITKQDLYALGLTGRANSSEARAALLKVLRLPEHMSTNALLQALNLRFSRADLLALFEKTEEESWSIFRYKTWSRALTRMRIF